MGIYHNVIQSDDSTNLTIASASQPLWKDEALDDIADLSRESTAEFLAGIIARQLFQLLLRLVDGEYQNEFVPIAHGGGTR
jgi:hypothetical protein